MNRPLSLLVTTICFLIFCAIYWILINNKTRRQEKTSDRKPTMFDVRRLLKEGEKDVAIRLYSKIFKVSSQQARKDIEELERSLNV